MGAILSCYYGYQFGRTLAGIFALSGTLNKDSAVYKVINICSLDTKQLHLINCIFTHMFITFLFCFVFLFYKGDTYNIGTQIT